VRRGHTLWNREGQALLASLPLAPHTAHRRSELQALYQHSDAQVDRLGERVKEVADERPRAVLLMTHPGVGAVTALATEVFVGDPCRFPHGKAVASYVGMIPSEYSSGTRGTKRSEAVSDANGLLDNPPAAVTRLAWYPSAWMGATEGATAFLSRSAKHRRSKLNHAGLYIDRRDIKGEDGGRCSRSTDSFAWRQSS